MWLSVQSIYSVHVVVVLSLFDGKSVTAHDISRTLGISRVFTLKILSMLKCAGIVGAVLGKNGGYRLIRPLDQITIFDVVTPFDDLGRYEGYNKRRSRCFKEECPMHKFWTDITETIIGKLRGTTGGEIVSFYKSKGLKISDMPRPFLKRTAM